MRTKVTLVLILLNLVLFGYIFYYEIHDPPANLTKRVLGAEAAAIDSFVRTGPSSATVRAEKKGDSWWLTQPYEWPANSTAISRILNELQYLEHETSFAVAELAKNGQSLADYGLAEPALSLTFTSGGKSYELKIGAGTRIGNRLYVLSADGSRIHVVGRSLVDSLDRPLADLRSPTIFTVPVFEVRSLGLQTAAPANLKVRLRRDGSRWAFETPILARASKAEVEGAIAGLNGLRASTFFETQDPAIERAGLDNAAMRVTLEGNLRRETLLIGEAVPAAAGAKPDPENEIHFARIEDKTVVFTVSLPTKLLNDLRNAQDRLREKRILDFEPRNVNAITIVSPGQPEIRLQGAEPAAIRAAASAAPATPATPAPAAEHETWQLVTRSSAGQAPQTVAADAAVVQELLQKLQLLQATRFQSDAPSAADLENWGFNRPEREITLSLDTGGGPAGTGQSTVTLQFGANPNEPGVAYARLANAPFVYQVGSEAVDLAPRSPLYYRQRLIRELPAGAKIVGLKLVDQSTDRVVYERMAPANAADATPKPEDQDPEPRKKAVTTVLRELTTLKAKRFIAESFNADHADFNGTTVPWKFRLEATLALSASTGTATTSTMTVLLTDRLGGTVMLAGTSEFGGLTFEATQELLDAVFALTYGEQHDPGPPPPEKPATEPAKPGTP